VERSFRWVSRLRRLASDYVRLPDWSLGLSSSATGPILRSAPLVGESEWAFFDFVSGKEAALLSPPPLRTAREPFDSSRSSLSNALLGTRFRHCQTKAVNLPVTNWM
jgi:hypothetical protein